MCTRKADALQVAASGQPVRPPSDQFIAKAWRKIRSLSQYRPWSADVEETDLLPLFRFRADKKGETRALEGKRYDRSTPYCLRGRRDEFNFLAQRLVSEPSALALVTGPPGHGKTALLQAVAEYAQRIGHTVIELQAVDLADADAIVQKCRDGVMTVEDAPAQTIHRYTDEIDTQTQATIDFVVTQLGNQISTRLGHETTRTETGQIDLRRHLEAVCQYKGQNRPLLILVDEVQKMMPLLDSDTHALSRAMNNLDILNNKIIGEQSKLPITTICAGVDPVRGQMEKLVSRPPSGSDLQLTSVANEHVRDIFGDYLSIKKSVQIPEHFFDESKLQEWADSCQGHVLAANQLGFLLQRFAIEKVRHGFQHVEKAGVKEIEGILASSRRNYYRSQLPNVSHEHRALDVVIHIVRATTHNRTSQESDSPNPLTWVAAEALARQALLTDPEQDQPDATDFDTIMHDLQHAGVIRYMEPRDHFLHLDEDSDPEPEEHCAIPIPSVTTYINRKYQKLPAEGKRRIEANVGKILRQYALLPGTRWQSRACTERRPIPKLQGVEYEPACERTHI